MTDRFNREQFTDTFGDVVAGTKPLEITEELIARQPPEAQAIIRILLARLAELEMKLGKTPKNSSLPPSSQHPHTQPPPKKKKSRRNRGGQPGHKNTSGRWFPAKRAMTC